MQISDSDIIFRMRVIWNPAITLDGNIAKSDGNSDWPTDEDGRLFEEAVQKCGAVIVGNRTYRQYKGKVFPIENSTTYVWTTNERQASSTQEVVFVSGTPQQVLDKIQKDGHEVCVLAGGTETNSAFVSAGLISEISITIYPLLLGNGMRLLNLDEFELKLELQSSSQIGNGVIHNRYKVLRK